jgi:glycerol uptake facilitator protein
MRDEPTNVQRFAAELVGTAFLVFVGVGSVPVTLILNARTSIAMPDLGVISLAFGLVIVAAVYSLGHVSGCHINPAVTLGLAASGNFPWRDVPLYVAAQLVGAIVGGVGIIAVLGRPALNAGLGVASYAHWGHGAAAELIGTFILVFTVLAVIHRKAIPGSAGIAIGFIVFAVIIAVDPASGGAINPARYVGPFLLEAVFGHAGAVTWAQFPVYIISEFIGGLLAAGVYIVVFRTPADGHSETAHIEAVSA